MEGTSNTVNQLKMPIHQSNEREKTRRRLDHFGALLLAAGLVMGLAILGSGSSSKVAPGRILKDHSHFEKALSSEDFSEYSCDNLYEHALSKESQCAYATTCNDGDGLFAPIIYCSTRYSTRFLSLALGIPLVLFLILLFRILGSTAEEFFSPGLEMMSLKLGLPERFAGVTLLALGNGAPDVASTVNAILNDRKNGYKMALGELLGSGLVASTVIVGAVAFVANGVVCRGALVRDVATFIATMVVVYLAFNDGTITTREIHGLVGLYLAYVCVVLAADVYHRKVVVPRKQLARQLSVEEDQENGMPVAETTKLMSGAGREQQRSYSVGDVMDPHGSKPGIFRRYMSDGEGAKKGKLERIIEAFSNYDEGDDDDDADVSVRTENGDWGHLETDGSEPLMVFHPHHGGIVDLKHSERVGSIHEKHLEATEIETLVKPTASQAPQSLREAFTTAWPELLDYFEQFWSDSFYNDEYNMVDKLLMTFELPFTIARMLTIPVPCEGYYCRPLIAISIALSPLWLWYYLWDQFDVDIIDNSAVVVVSFFFVPVLIGLLVLRFAPCGDVPPRLSVAVPITLIGFCVSATWLDLIADLLVSLLSLFGILSHVPGTIMGLTVLAWGNSSQDLIANTTVARKGLSTMAITASFAGPVFNILVGLGIGLALLYGMGNGEPIVVELNIPLEIGFLFSVLSGILVIFCGICIGKGYLPKQYGYVAMVLYFAYAITSLVL
jgi:sodium/potassium/calcium exchanger 6